MFTSSSLYLASVATTMLQAEAVIQSPVVPSLCMKPTTGEWVIVNPINPSGPALGFGTLPVELLNDATLSDADRMPQLPDNLLSWLQYVDDAKAYIAQHPEAAVSEYERLAMAPAVGVEPLMPHISWEQGAPYNQFVPTGCPTGCVATALSQIMYFYRYPAQGSGYHSYNWGGETLEVNFAEQTYDWDLMFDQYLYREHTAEQTAEVAKLCYHVGVAMDMMYAPGGSGAYDMRVNERMRDYFNYNPYGTVLSRATFGMANWTRIINRELSLGHPIYMSGSSNEGGHAFVLDGVNTEGYYSVNWGWGGAYDGWFDISIMRPAGFGTGASPSSDGFAWNEAIYAGFTPDVPADSIYYTTLQDYYVSASVESDTLYSELWLLNTGATSQKGTIFFDLMKGDELIDRYQIADYENYRYWRERGVSVAYPLPEELADGDYQIRFRFCNEDGLWSSILGYRPAPDFINLNVQDGVKTASIEDLDVKMTAIEWNFDALYAGQQHQVSALIRNDGQEPVAGLWYLHLTYENGFVQDVEATNIVTIAPQESKRVTFLPTFDNRGECLAQIGLFRQSEDDYTVWEVQASDTLMQILDDGTFGADISLTAATYLHSGDCEVNGTITVAAPLQNLSEAYVGDLVLKIFADKNLSTEVMSSTCPYTIGEQESDTALLSITLDKAKAKRSYYAAVFLRRGNSYIQIPGEENKLKLIVKEEGHSAGIEQINADTDQHPSIRRDLFGRPVNNPDRQGFEIRDNNIILIR